jgi:hypothetical protein
LQEPPPSGGFGQEYAATGEGNTDDKPFAVVTNPVGESVDADTVRIQDADGNSVYWDAVWTGGAVVEPGETVHIDGFGSDSALNPICAAGQTYWVVWEDDDGDGIPNWC